MISVSFLALVQSILFERMDIDLVSGLAKIIATQKEQIMRLLSTLLISSIMVLSACGPRQFSKGEYDDPEEQNLMNDRWSESDMQKVVAKLVNKMIRHRSISRAKKPPVVMVTHLQNKTAEHIDTQNIMDMVKVELMNTGSVSFVDKEARDDVAEEYEYQKEFANNRTAKSKGNQTGADYILNGRLDSIVQEVGKRKTVYYKVTLYLTNLSTNVSEWAGYEQIRKKFKKRRVGL